MLRFVLPLLAGPVFLAACDSGPVNPESAAVACERRAQGAQGPTGSVTLGASSDDGPFVGTQIGITGDYLAGRDPLEVYEACVYQRTGAAPIRPPRLRS